MVLVASRWGQPTWLMVGGGLRRTCTRIETKESLLAVLLLAEHLVTIHGLVGLLEQCLG